VLRNWETLKAAELGRRGRRAEPASMLDSVKHGLPAVMEAFQMTTKVSRVGFDWPDARAVLQKLDEELGELRRALHAAAPPPAEREVAEELGDLLFVTVNLARVLGVDPESALKAANRKFRRRFRFVEERLHSRGRQPADSNLAEMDALWGAAKAEGL
jgi:MazG family protein